MSPTRSGAVSLIFPPRQDSDSIKWQRFAGKDVLPLWIADSDFAAPLCVTEALQARISHGVFGYGETPQELSELIVERLWQRYDWRITADDIVYLPGLVTALHLAVQTLTQPNDAVFCPTPIYPPFRQAIKQHGRDGVFQDCHTVDGRWLPQLPSHAKAKDIRLAMVCNPLNPGGTVFRRDELLKLDALAKTNDWIVCSDEIHCDLLIDENARHIPYASLNDDAAQRAITLMAPSKTFNIAGLGCAFAVIQNPTLRRQIQQALEGLIPAVNILGFHAAIAAYRHGDDWLQQQLAFLRQQHQKVLDAVNALPGLSMLPNEATYLAWIDASQLNHPNPSRLFEQFGLGLSPGSAFGNRQFVRLNFACSDEVLDQALTRLRAAVGSLAN
uniref:MalY/PatB family protein n=1 Tax=Thaumasiovibrio occultus TaxID=1891184 RepID=UPI000B35FE39|nr:PatB family C-S lyase [Thaumasiovibrio occultus]